MSVAASRGSLSGKDLAPPAVVMRSAQSFPRSFVIEPSVACRAGGVRVAALRVAVAELGGYVGPPTRFRNAARRQPALLPRASPLRDRPGGSFRRSERRPWRV